MSEETLIKFASGWNEYWLWVFLIACFLYSLREAAINPGAFVLNIIFLITNTIYLSFAIAMVFSSNSVHGFLGFLWALISKVIVLGVPSSILTFLYLGEVKFTSIYMQYILALFILVLTIIVNFFI